tara:strand:- start:39900 stop:40370 length:471 start_codon:yes stop_codon:yes gene_type:complete
MINVHKHLITLTLVVIFGFGCSGISTERTSDASAVSAYSEEVFDDIKVGSANTLYFEYDQFSLTDSARAKIKNLSEEIKMGNLKVRIEGHCDERGTREYNLALGERRANSVAELLTIYGVSRSKISTVSYGEEKPAVQGSNDLTWSKNRRALVKTY